MPNKWDVACNFPNCKGVALPGSPYCEAHQKSKQDTAKERDARRYEEHKEWRRLYDTSGWKKHLQPFGLARDPICKLQTTPLCKQHGGDPSTVVDHIVDHKGDPNLFYDPNNIQGVCKPCHDAKRKMRAGEVADTNAPDTTGEAGRQYVSSSNKKALDDFMEHFNDEDLSDVKIPED